MTKTLLCYCVGNPVETLCSRTQGSTQPAQHPTTVYLISIRTAVMVKHIHHLFFRLAVFTPSSSPSLSTIPLLLELLPVSALLTSSAWGDPSAASVGAGSVLVGEVVGDGEEEGVPFVVAFVASWTLAALALRNRPIIDDPALARTPAKKRGNCAFVI